MADDDKKPEPTQEQVEAANKAEEAKWQGDFDEKELVVPYKREEDEKPDNGNKSDTDESADDNGTKPTGDDDKDIEEFTDPTPVVTVEDPGEFKPQDYSFEVTLKGGKTVKVTTPEEADKLADDPDNFETPRQLSDFLKKQMKMERGLERDREKYDEQKSKFTEQVELETQRRETVDIFAKEMQYLVDEGKMPAVDKKYLEAEWSDPEVAKQPGVKEQISLLNYMAKENQKRAKAGIKPLTSVIDAYNAWQLDSKQVEEKKRKEQEEAEHKAAGEARRNAGARVAGVSPASQGTYVPKGIAVGRTNVFGRGGAQWED